MLQVNPAKRLSAAEYLERLSANPVQVGAGLSVTKGDTDGPAEQNHGIAGGKSVAMAPIPPSFDSVLFPLLKRLRSPLSPDARIALAASHYDRVVRETVGIEDRWGKR